MNPMLIMMAMSALSGMKGMGGQNAEQKSSYGKNQLGQIDSILQQLKGGAPDITQNQGFQGGQEWLNDLFNDPEFFKSFEAPMQRQFEEETIPGLANRFGAEGSGGSLGSTGFRNQLAREGSNLSTNIAAMRGGMQQQGVNQALGYAQAPFQNYMQMMQSVMNPTQNMYQPASAGPFGNIMASLSGGMAQGYGQQYGKNMAGV